MNKSLTCKQHPNFIIQWVRILKDNIIFGCIKCQNAIQDWSDIIYLPDIIDNPNVVIPHLPIDKQYIKFYNELNEFKEEELEEKFVLLEKQFKCLIELLQKFIESGRSNLEEFKKKCKESKQLLYQELKISKIGQLIKELYQQTNENQDVQDQIMENLIDITDKINKDLMKEQSSNIKKIFNDIQLAIHKVNLYCNKQINDISTQISKNTEDLKAYFNKQFQSILFKSYFQKSIYNRYSENIIKMENFAWCLNKNINHINFPYYFSTILPQYYFDSLINNFFYNNGYYNYTHTHPKQYNGDPLQIKQYQIFKPGNQEIVKEQSAEYYAKLIIFKSNNNGNPIFGYFCKTNHERGYQTKINYDTQFIFSFTHNEFYPKRKLDKVEQQQQNSKDMQQSKLFNIDEKNVNFDLAKEYSFHGLAFPDLLIHTNLIDGQSKLGDQFIWDSQNDEIQKNEYLFGGPKPNIQLCEVFYF